jgi:hypothetical protein
VAVTAKAAAAVAVSVADDGGPLPPVARAAVVVEEERPLAAVGFKVAVGGDRMSESVVATAGGDIKIGTCRRLFAKEGDGLIALSNGVDS